MTLKGQIHSPPRNQESTFASCFRDRNTNSLRFVVVDIPPVQLPIPIFRHSSTNKPQASHHLLQHLVRFALNGQLILTHLHSLSLLAASAFPCFLLGSFRRGKIYRSTTLRAVISVRWI